MQKYIVRILAGAALLLSQFQTQAQQELMLSQMPDVWQMNSINPSFFPESKRFALGLPGIAIDAAHSGTATYNDFLRKENGKTVVDFNEFIGKLEQVNTLDYQQRIETASFGFRLPGPGKTAISASHAIRLTSHSTYQRELFQLLWQGNAQFIGQTVEIGPETNTYDWHEISVGASRNFGKSIRVGAKAKYLSGISYLKTDPNAHQASVYTNPDIYQLELNTNYGFTSAGTISAIDTSGLGFKVVTNELRNKSIGDAAGLAFDLGITAKITDKITVYASILDIGGKINFKSANYFKSNGTYAYDGATLPGSGIINGDSLDFSVKLDTLNDIFQFQKSAATAEATLPLRVYLSGIYQVTKRIRVGASFMNETQDDRSRTAYGVSAHFQPLRFIGFGAMFSRSLQQKSNLGFQLTLQPGPVQLFVASDNLLNAFTPYASSAVNFRAGLGMVF